MVNELNQASQVNHFNQLSLLNQLKLVVVSQVKLLHLNQLCHQDHISQVTQHKQLKIFHAKTPKYLNQVILLHAIKFKQQQEPLIEKNFHLGGSNFKAMKKWLQLFFFCMLNMYFLCIGSNLFLKNKIMSCQL